MILESSSSNAFRNSGSATTSFSEQGKRDRLHNPPKRRAAASSAPSVSVRKGDTLWEIAERKLGSGSRWHELRQDDGSKFTAKEARKLQIGTSVYLPKSSPSSTVKLQHSDGSKFTARDNKSSKADTQAFVPVKQQAAPSRSERIATLTVSGSDRPKTAPAVYYTSKTSAKVASGDRDSFLARSQSKGNAKPGADSDTWSNAAVRGTVTGTAVGTFLANRKLSPVPTEASRAAKPHVLKATLPDGSTSIKEIPLKRVRYSQATVSPALSGEGASLSEVAKQMRKHGWDYTKEPPDVVKFEGRKLSIAGRKIPIQRSRYVTLDHRRLVAAKEAGIKKIPARVHLEKDPIRHDVPSKPGSAGSDVATRFKLGKKAGYTDPETKITHKPGSQPKSWGEAAKHRAAGQRARGHSDFPLKGQRSLPKISEPSSTVRVGKSIARSGVAKGVLRGSSRAALPVAVGLDTWQLGSSYKKHGFGKEFRKDAGRVAGAWGGAAAGAAIGSAIFPGVGTVVGGVIGGVAGSSWGDDIEQGAEKLGSKVADGAKKAWRGLFG